MIRQIVFDLSKELNLDPYIIQAVLDVESNAHGFENGKLVIRFEVHKWYKYWGIKNPKTFEKHFQFNPRIPWSGHKFNGKYFHDNQKLEHKVFDFAKQFNVELAHWCISMGIAQILGENYADLGYKSAVEMYEDFSKSIDNQIRGMFKFITRNNLDDYLRNKQFVKFSAGYNGTANKDAYGKKIENRYRILTNAV